MNVRNAASIAVTALIAAAIASASLVGGAGIASATGSTADSGFIDGLETAGIQPSSLGEAIRVAHVVCDELDNGASMGELIDSTYEANEDLSYAESMYFVVTSVSSYCPDLG